jgi:hypothetical protein
VALLPSAIPLENSPFGFQSVSAALAVRLRIDFMSALMKLAFLAVCLQVDPPPSYEEVVDKAPRYSSLFQVTDSGEVVPVPTHTDRNNAR